MVLNVMGMFDHRSDAEAAARELQDAGFGRTDISFVGSQTGGHDVAGATSGETHAGTGAGTGATSGAVLGGLAGLLAGLGVLVIPGIGPVLAAGTFAAVLGSTAVGAGIGAAAGGLLGALVGSGVPEEDAHVYAEGVRRGGSLLSVLTDDQQQADRAATIMNRNNVVDIDRRYEDYRASGWTRFDPNAAPYERTSTVIDTTSGSSVASVATTVPATMETGVQAVAAETGEIHVPVVEESLRVGTRTVERGGVRVYRHVIETPVTEQVTLRSEHVFVERRPVDIPASDADFANVPVGTVEAYERSEEAVVTKEARIVEEVVINKQVEERTETIQDTVRRSHVNVEELTAQTRTSGSTTISGTTMGSTTGSVQDEGAIEGGVSRAGNALERGTGLDLDRDGNVGTRDPRNNV